MLEKASATGAEAMKGSEMNEALLAEAVLESIDTPRFIGGVSWRHHFYADGANMGYEYKKIMKHDGNEGVDMIIKADGDSPHCVVGRLVTINNNPPKFQVLAVLLPYYDEIGRTGYFGMEDNGRMLIIEPNPEFDPESQTDDIPEYVGKRITQGPIPEATPDGPH